MAFYVCNWRALITCVCLAVTDEDRIHVASNACCCRNRVEVCGHDCHLEGRKRRIKARYSMPTLFHELIHDGTLDTNDIPTLAITTWIWTLPTPKTNVAYTCITVFF